MKKTRSLLATTAVVAALAAPQAQAQVAGALSPLISVDIPFVSKVKKGFATEFTQVLNNLLLGKQLHEDTVHTAELIKIDEQTMLSVLGQPVSTHPLTDAAVDVARGALGSRGVPYGLEAALGEYEETFHFTPQGVTTYEGAEPIFDRMRQSRELTAQETVATVAAHSESDLQAREAVNEAVDLSQGSVGQTQALMAGNQINAAVHGKLSSISGLLQANAYQEARKEAAELAEIRAAAAQRAHDTRDFVTGPYPGPVSAEPSAIFTGTFGPGM